MRLFKIFLEEIHQAFVIAIKDMKVYYLRPGMIMFGLLMPFFMFFSFSVRRGISADAGIASLLALTVFFTSAAAGPFVIPLERRTGTYDRLLAAPNSLLTLLFGKTLVGAIFGMAVAFATILVWGIIYGFHINQPLWLAATIVIGAFSFSALGLIFGSIPTRNPGDVQMPSTLLRWSLMFVSGVFIPVSEMNETLRTIAYLSPLTYAQDLFNYIFLGSNFVNPWISLFILIGFIILFFIPSLMMHKRSLKLGF